MSDPILAARLTSHTSGTDRARHAHLRRLRRQHGFSMIEMLVVMAVITIIMAAVFRSINITQQTSTSQQIKLDLTQQAREFVDQLTIDLRNSGYPNQRNLTNVTDASSGYLLISPEWKYNAPGLIYVNSGSLWFAGDVDGTSVLNGGNPTGQADVRIVRYDYFATGTNCPCLRRSEFLRAGGDPYTDVGSSGTPVAQLEIQGVQNTNIFTVYDDTGTALTLPLAIDNTSDATVLANINSLKVLLTVKSVVPDSTGAYPTTTVASSIALNNCSEAMGNGQTPTYCN